MEVWRQWAVVANLMSERFSKKLKEDHGPQPARENDRERFELLHHYRGLGRAVGRSQIQGDFNLV
jgi:hypothetical protein